MSGHLCDKRDTSRELCLGSNKPGLLSLVSHPITYPAHSFLVVRLIHWLIHFVPTSFAISRPFSILILSTSSSPLSAIFSYSPLTLSLSHTHTLSVSLSLSSFLYCARGSKLMSFTWLHTQFCQSIFLARKRLESVFLTVRWNQINTNIIFPVCLLYFSMVLCLIILIGKN